MVSGFIAYCKARGSRATWSIRPRLRRHAGGGEPRPIGLMARHWSCVLAYKRGEPRVCAIVSAPTPEDEDNRRLCRERKALTAERIQHVNRIKGLLFSQGVSDYEPLRRNRRQRLDELKTGDSRPLPMHLKAQIGRELDRLELLLEQIKAVEAERDALFASAKPTEETSALPAMLVGLKGIGPEFAAVLWSEGLYQIFANRKQIAAYAGFGAYALAKWNRRARARRIQSRESAAADDDDPACLALAETSAAFGTGAMVQGTRQTQRRAPAQNDDRGACAQIVSRVVEICECRRRHRRRCNEGLLIDDLNRLTQSTETRSVSADRGRRIDGAYGLNSRQQEWSRPPEPHPPQAGYWCSRFARRPNVSLIWCGDDQVTEAGSNLGYRNSLRSFAYAPLNLALDPNTHVSRATDFRGRRPPRPPGLRRQAVERPLHRRHARLNRLRKIAADVVGQEIRGQTRNDMVNKCWE